MPSAASDVTALSAMPHGTMWSNIDRSGSTLRAKPCIVRRRPGATRLARTPMAAILRGRSPVGVDPHARVLAGARQPGQAEVGQRVDDQLLEAVARAPGPTPACVGHREDRVADELARAVVGDVAAAVGPHQLGADRRRVDQHVASDRRARPRV